MLYYNYYKNLRRYCMKEEFEEFFGVKFNISKMTMEELLETKKDINRLFFRVADELYMRSIYKHRNSSETC